MKHIYLFAVALLFWLLAACVPTNAPEPAVDSATPMPPPSDDSETPGAVLNARQALASQQQINLERVDVVFFEEVEWPNACLGLPTVDEMCAEVVTPGYRITLAIDSLTYVYHADAEATNLRLAERTPALDDEAILRWQGETETGCQTAVFTASEVAFGPCSGELTSAPYAPPGQALTLLEMAGRYGPFTAETPTGQIEWMGTGAITAVAAQQRALAAWAEAIWRAVSSGDSADENGLAFTWHREGGIAGFCDDLEVTQWGTVTLSGCGRSEPEFIGQTYLSSEQLILLYTLLDSLSFHEREQVDSATADGMTQRVVFYGRGTADMSESDWLTLQALAQTLMMQASQPINPDAAAIVQEYLAALAFDDFGVAAAHYGGNYEVLAGYNPDLDSEDHIALLERACTANGFQCLPVRNVVETAVVLPDQFRVFVEFSQADGALFVQASCCGAAPGEMPPQSQFGFTVGPDGDGVLRVLDLPVYTP